MRSTCTRLSCCFGLALALMGNHELRGQQTPGAPAKKIVGVMDPKTGAFTPLLATEEIHPDAATTPATTGTVSLVITVKLASTDLARSSILCTLDLAATSTNLTTYSVGIWEESAGSPATISGSTATCTLTIPYSWLLPAASSTVSNVLSASFYVYASGGTTTAPVLLRGSNQDLFSGVKVPASGTNSAYTASVTL